MFTSTSRKCLASSLRQATTSTARAQSRQTPCLPRRQFHTPPPKFNPQGSHYNTLVVGGLLIISAAFASSTFWPPVSHLSSLPTNVDDSYLYLVNTVLTSR
ncbi:hypothetical protein L211DRAFT_815082 [Terfezia boudieri ATCC MYA-4762]|uniref:Uncharacterized protein n=1 Tax=Terfezia boudieri ATCC MYA-4762 TaxID=1051890 RepID=A0A3N4L859_9PEZI|nr:hypothetical protein L211DRAFT_815082 [Terfezia boudieri ATCC MYA-4762]